MKISKILKLSFNMLMHSKLRSWLTILGIFIGVAAVVAIISLGQGLQQNVSAQIQGLGQDIITISAGSSRAAFGGFGEGGGGRSSAAAKVNQLSDNEIQSLKLIPNVKYINGVISGRAKLVYQGQTTTSSIQGYDPSIFKEFVTTSLDSGRYLTSGDVKSIVIGSNVAQNMFKNKIGIGYVININDKPFRVIGIFSASTSGFGGSDNSIYMSTKDAREILGNATNLKSDEYSSLIIKVADAQLIQDTSTAIENELINSRHVTKDTEDFSINSAAALQQRFNTVTSGITLFLGVIAAVSLLVGSIGVANTMFTSVLEKTRDIGVMKAIGARNSDILLIFLFNSGLLGLVGGILGIVFTIVLSFAVPYLGISLGNAGTLTIPINIWLMLFAVVFSVLIGMISGAIPAYRASKLNPVEALRYE